MAYFETGNAAEAYRRAYDVSENARDNWLYVEASQLLDHPMVAQRLEELEEQAQKLSMFTRQKALDEYEEARALAIKSGAAAAAVSATSGKVKLFGLDAPKRHELTGKSGGPIETEDKSSGAAKLAAFLDGIAERSGTPGEPDA